MSARSRAMHAPGIPCGLPSPGSRRQAYVGSEKLRPMQEEQALVARVGEPITCKRCKRIVRRSRG
jgi:hypothetical protein